MEISTEKPLDRTEKKVTFGKPIFRQTPLPPGKGVIIAAAEGEECLMAAQSIQERLESLGCQVQVLHNPEHEILFRSKMPVIAMGNLANSRCVKYLYYKFLCLTDKSYPGKEGYNIRTLVDPFATGHNIIHIGYSDDDGLKNGVKAFLDKIQNPLPYINEVYYTRLAFDEEYISGIMQATLPEKIDLIPSSGATNWWQLGTANRTPVDNPFSPVDQSLFIQTDKDLGNGFGQAFVHGKPFSFPVTGAPQLFQLAYDSAAVLLFPFPCSFQELFSS
jgi:hypothetical protein